MTIPSSRALMPVPVAATPSDKEPRGQCSGALSQRRKWLLTASAVLALAAVALGSMWLGFAAILPFLYVLPCLIMASMCMRHARSSNSS